MNRLDGIVDSCGGNAGVMSVRVACSPGVMEALVFDRPGGSSWLKPGSAVRVSFKESDALLAPPGGFPWPGAIPARVLKVTESDILARVDLGAAGVSIASLAPLARLAALGIGESSEIDFWVPPHEVVLEEIEP